MEGKIIKAKKGFEFVRIHDNFKMGETIYLGYDYSTGKKRVDLAEYYKEVEKLDEKEQDK